MSLNRKKKICTLNFVTAGIDFEMILNYSTVLKTFKNILKVLNSYKARATWTINFYSALNSAEI